MARKHIAQQRKGSVNLRKAHDVRGEMQFEVCHPIPTSAACRQCSTAAATAPRRSPSTPRSELDPLMDIIQRKAQVERHPNASRSSREAAQSLCRRLLQVTARLVLLCNHKPLHSAVVEIESTHPKGSQTEGLERNTAYGILYLQIWMGVASGIGE